MAIPLRLAVLLALSFIGIQATSAIPSSEITSKSAQGLRLIQLGEDLEPVWKTDDEKENLIRSRTRFFDIQAAEISYGEPAHHATVKSAIADISVKNMQANLGTLTKFHNRWYKSSTGAAASKWILKTVKAIAAGKPGVTAYAFTHPWAQSSTIVRFAGKNKAGPITIISAHMDSVGIDDKVDIMAARAPGADDDGSGTVNLLEAFRVLVRAGFHPANPVEFHWYSGEEAGMLGSLAIAAKYKSEGIHVKGDLHLDMTAFTPPGTPPVAALITDDTNPALTDFVAKLVRTYTNLGVARSECGYACSDHTIHTKHDTTNAPGFSWPHTLEFTKLAVAFAYEMAT
ncbi:Peptide hydrolase [Pleurotus pulmonarius]